MLLNIQSNVIVDIDISIVNNLMNGIRTNTSKSFACLTCGESTCGCCGYKHRLVVNEIFDEIVCTDWRLACY